MSKKRQPDENPESPDALLALFEQIAHGGPRTPKEWSAIWRTVLNDAWLQAEVRRRAEWLVRSHHLQEDAVDDISQQVFAFLAEKAAEDPTMHVNAGLVSNSFLAWIGTILNRASSEAARLIGLYRRRHATLGDEELGDERVVADTVRYCECRADLAAAVERLEGRENSVMRLFLEGLKRNQIAEQLGLSYKQVRYAIEQAVPKLRLMLAAYRQE